MVCCYAVEFLAAGCCGYPKFRWFRVLLDKFMGCLIRDTNTGSGISSVTNLGGLVDYLGEEYQSACPTVIQFYRCLLSNWKTKVSDQVFIFLCSNVVFLTASVPASESVVWSPAICGKGSSGG